jgi:L-ascorbate metabolism protein UlaG (beta-lactamase superfamily)
MTACTPAQHFSNRGLLDFNKSLWASWVFKTGDKSFFFAGDTGYRSVEKGMSFEEETRLPVCPEFKKIGEKYGTGI